MHNSYTKTLLREIKENINDWTETPHSSLEDSILQDTTDLMIQCNLNLNPSRVFKI